MIPVLAVLVLYWILGRTRPRWETVPAFVLPLTLYAVLPLRSRHQPVLDWGNPETWEGFRWMVTGAPYHGNLLGGGWEPFVERAGLALTRGPVAQVGWIAVVLAVLGASACLVRARREGLVLVLLWVGATLVAAAYAIPDPGAYYLPALLVVSVLAGGGAAGLLRGVRVVPRGMPRTVATAGAVALCVAMLGAQVYRVRPLADATGEVAGYGYAESVRHLEPAALVVSHGDGRTFSLWYGTVVLADRGDVAVLYDTLLDWTWYRESVGRAHPQVALSPRRSRGAARRLDLVRRNVGHRPVYVTQLDPGLLDRYTVSRTGPLYRVSPRRDRVTEAASSDRTHTE